MSNIELKSEINTIIKKSGYSRSKDLLCPLMRVVSMRHKDVPSKQIHGILKELLC
ncbi:hypothetical protein [Sulfurimonas paralvinellae]|uniref:hypothetical protein n=1 Tax=Sulfurimonas paralvinellae TaxID=317658 RepID=UPI001867C92E|nr:hypothetical protein [Sulfurimonas paralvinellae]